MQQSIQMLILSVAIKINDNCTQCLRKSNIADNICSYLENCQGRCPVIVKRMLRQLHISESVEIVFL